ncbi:MAG: SDR family oxidoreductase [Saprospiraceae bacterium]
MDFKNKIVWITGASSGIGEHLAYALAEQGAKLILSSRNEKELQRVKNNCHQDSDILLLPLDVADFAAIPPSVEMALQHFGKIDILINNAGISQRSLIKDTALEVDQKIMNINYLGTVAMTKAVLPVMLKQGHGQMVVISSVMGKVGVPYRSAYAASKHALHGFFDALRAEVAKDNIDVTVILPGYVRTNVTINALRGDGSQNSVMAPETAKGMDPGIFAQRALKAIANKREEVLIGNKEIYAVLVKRLFPGFLSYMTKRIKFAAEQR